jgi:hypothetical protein
MMTMIMKGAVIASDLRKIMFFGGTFEAWISFFILCYYWWFPK